jgi:pimeloyl-ACP methyl ester carboxylesterase
LGETPSGILLNRVHSISRVEDFDGTDSSAIASLRVWQQQYHEVHQASREPLSWPDIVTLNKQAKQRYKTGVIPIAILNAAYIRTSSDHLGDETFSENQRGSPKKKNLALEQRRLFAVSALVDYTHRGSGFSLLFDSSFHFTNDEDGLPELRVNFADGRGFLPVNFDKRNEISYETTGDKTILVRATYPSGQAYTGRFTFRVENLETPVPHETWFREALIPYENGLGSGEAFIYLSDEHTSLTRPVLMIEGFDIDNSLNWDELYHLMNKENLLETLRSDGFDFVVLNFIDSTDYIQRHAFLTVALIQEIIALISPETRLVLVGASMGGLVGRYSLSYMEQNQLDHRVRTFIAFDSPHQGANIPLGIQHWVDFFAPESAEAAFLRDALNSPAARQMLIYQYAASPPGGGASDPLRGIFLAELEGLGRYPQQLRRVAVGNGSGIQTDQGYPAGEQLILYEYSDFFVHIIGNAWALPDGNDLVVFQGLIDRIWPLPDDERTVSVSGTLPYDNAPGGFRPSMAQMDTVPVSQGDVIALHDNHCFIPTISALDIDTADPFYFVAGDPEIMSKTPFHEIYYPLENQEHNIITPENKLWFIEEVHGVSTSVEEIALSGAPGLEIFPNFPNPFNPTTHLLFHLSQDSWVTLEILNLRGERNRTLVENEKRLRGLNREVWDGRDDHGRDLPSGIYIYRLMAGNLVKTNRMTMIR